MDDEHSGRWAGLAFMAGGVLMAGLWVIFTSVHGPTSFNEDGVILGRSTLFWGSLLGGPPNLLVALGLLLLYPRLARGAGRLARIGYGLAVFGLIASAALDLAIGALGAPFFVPLVGLGLILLSAGNRQLPARQRRVLLFIGVVLVVAFAWALLPQDLSDRISGYRLYGLLAHFVPGLAWAWLGVSGWQTAAAPAAIPSPLE